MNYNNNEEEILEDIQIEEDEYEDVTNKNSIQQTKIIMKMKQKKI